MIMRLGETWKGAGEDKEFACSLDFLQLQKGEGNGRKPALLSFSQASPHLHPPGWCLDRWWEAEGHKSLFVVLCFEPCTLIPSASSLAIFSMCIEPPLSLYHVYIYILFFLELVSLKFIQCVQKLHNHLFGYLSLLAILVSQTSPWWNQAYPRWPPPSATRGSRRKPTSIARHWASVSEVAVCSWAGHHHRPRQLAEHCS